MNWISTNIRFPEDQYRKLKLKALKERKSLAKIVREATSNVVFVEQKPKKRIKNVEKFMKEIEKIAKENAKYTKGFDSVKALREIRYNE